MPGGRAKDHHDPLRLSQIFAIELNMAAPDKEQGHLESILGYLRDCETLVEQTDIIDGLSQSHPSIIFGSDSYSQESFVLNALRLLKIDSSSSFTERVSESLVFRFDHFALLNASYICLKELGYSRAKNAAKHSASFTHEVTALRVASSIIIRLILDDQGSLWNTNHESIGESRLFSMILSVPSFVSRAYHTLGVHMPQNFIPEVFQEKLIAATVKHQVFPTVVRAVLRRNKGRAIGRGLATAERHHLATANDKLQKYLSGREKADLVHSILELSVLKGLSLEVLQQLCSSLISTSLEECCKKMVLTSAIPLDVSRSNQLSSSFADLCINGNASVSQNDDSDWQEELARVDMKDYTLWRALIEVTTIWSSTAYVRQSDYTCQSRATSFVLRALEIVKTNPIPLDSVVPMRLMSGVSVRLNSTHKSIRFDGMRVGELLARQLGEEVQFDELHTTPTALSSATVASSSSEAQATCPRADDDSSEGSVSFQTYDLVDDQEDLLDVQRPLFLSECLNYFRTPESEDNALIRVELALKSVTQLVRSMPADLHDHAQELARAILHLENKSNMDRFEEISADALASLVAMAPLAVGTSLIDELFLCECSLGNRISALNALSDAAAELSGIRADDNLNSFSHLRLLSNDSDPPTTSITRPASQQHQVRKSDNWNSSMITEVLPIWFYLISKHFVNTVEDESLWGGEIGALFLANVIRTLSCVVYFVADYLATVDIIAMDLYRFVWNFWDADTPEVRSAVIQAAGVSFHVVSIDLKKSLINDGMADALLPTLIRTFESDPDDRCRASAKLTVDAIIAAGKCDVPGDMLIMESNRS